MKKSVRWQNLTRNIIYFFLLSYIIILFLSENIINSRRKNHIYVLKIHKYLWKNHRGIVIFSDAEKGGKMSNTNPNYFSDFDTFPNQKQVKIIRETVEKSKENGRPYLIAYCDNLKEAMLSLTPAAFKVYVCLLFNADGFKLRFSPENIHKITGLCKDTIRKAMTQLEQKGYLKSIDWYRYVFTENRKSTSNTDNW